MLLTSLPERLQMQMTISSTTLPVVGFITTLMGMEQG